MRRNLTVAATLMSLAGFAGAGTALAQLPVPASTQFDLTGFLQEASLGGPGAGALQGGTLKVNGQSVVVPSGTIVILPASAYTWQELFALSPAPYTGVATGLALADLPAPLTTWEVHVVGNRLCQTQPNCGGANDLYIAGMIDIHQNSLNSGAGFINFMDYSTGEMRVGGILGNPTTGTRVRLSDPLGRFGRTTVADARFSVDDANPTMSAGTGFPMCFPRVAPSGLPGVETDPLCPQGNRPAAIAPAQGFASMIQMSNPATIPLGGALDPRIQAPFQVGDYVNFAGTLVADPGFTAGPISGPWPGQANTYISAHTIGDNVAIYTWPGTNPAYVAIEVGLIGTGGLTVVGAGEAAARSKFEGMTTDETRGVHLYGIDFNPLTGATTDRDFGTIVPDPGAAAGGAVRGRWRFRPPCLPFGTVPTKPTTQCVYGPSGTFLPPPREVRAVIEGLQSQNPQNPLALTAANGIYWGQYHAPIGEYIFPENIPGTPIVENNFNTIEFLTLGGYSSSTGVVAGTLNPWPGISAPTPTCTAPVASSGGPYTAPNSGTIPLTGSATGSGPFTFSWTAAAGTFSDPSVANPTYTAPASGAVGLTLTVTNACGTSTSSTTVTVAAPTAPTVVQVPPMTAFSGANGSFVVAGSDPNVPTQALTFQVAQSGTPGLTVLTVVQLTPSSARVNFTAPVLPVGQVLPSLVNLTITATNTSGVVSATSFTTITVQPTPDTVTITAAEYRIGKTRLTINATSSVVSPNVALKLNPYACAVPNVAGVPPCPNGIFDPTTIGNTFTNNGGGVYSLTLVGAPEPAVPPATPLTVRSNLGTTSAPRALTKISN